MTYRIRSHPLVDHDIETLRDWLLDRAEPFTVDRRLTQIESTIQFLREFPHTGTLRTEVDPGLRAIPTAEHGVIAFQVNDQDQEIYIIAITFAGADWIARTQRRLSDDR